MKIDILRVKLTDEYIQCRDIPKIRGFFSHFSPEVIELHNHIDEKFNYGYPTVQYKSISGSPYLLAIGSETIKNILDTILNVDHVDIGKKVIQTKEKGFYVEKLNLGIENKLSNYQFISPWLPLNQVNYKLYINSSNEEKEKILKKIMIGNILSMSKKFKYTVDKEILVFLKLKPLTVKFKNKEMIAFKGNFLCNFDIPNYLGLGKSVSRGFGTVAKIKDETYI